MTYLLTVILLFSGQSAWAGFITTNESGLDVVFSQTNFGADTIDIRFNPDVIIQNTSLLNIDTDTKLNALFALAPSASTVVNLFFVDTLDSCGGFNTAIVGCAAKPGNRIVVESNFASGASGTELIAHELGHNLGLDHVSATTNLMNPVINGNTDLTSAQVSTILGSSLVQTDVNSNRKFISVAPIAIVTAVPIPGAILLFGSGLFSLFFSKRRRKA